MAKRKIGDWVGEKDNERERGVREAIEKEGERGRYIFI